MEAVQITIKYLLKNWKDISVENMEAVTIVCAPNRKGIQQRCLHCPRAVFAPPTLKLPRVHAKPWGVGGAMQVMSLMWLSTSDRDRGPSSTGGLQSLTICNIIQYGQDEKKQNTRNILEPGDESIQRKTDPRYLRVFRSRYRNRHWIPYESDIE